MEHCPRQEMFLSYWQTIISRLRLVFKCVNLIYHGIISAAVRTPENDIINASELIACFPVPAPSRDPFKKYLQWSKLINIHWIETFSRVSQMK